MTESKKGGGSQRRSGKGAAKGATPEPSPAPSRSVIASTRLLAPAAWSAVAATRGMRAEMIDRIVAASSLLAAIEDPTQSPATLPDEALRRAPQQRDMLATSVMSSELLIPAALQVLAIHTATAMDPRLQLAVANRRSGKPGLTLAATAADEVAVVSRVTSVDEWEALADVLPGSTLGRLPDTTWIVTARLPIERAESIRAEPCVVSLKAAQSVQPSLAATVAAMKVAPAALPAGTDPAGGEGVVIGIVDFGCDFAHSNFRNADGSTRIEAIWHQAGVATPTSPFGYGRLILAADIDAALAAPSPYSALRYGPAPDTAQELGAHGTHVMDISAGNGNGSGQAGVAPAATLIFVEVSTNDIAWQGAAAVTQSFGDSVHLLEAVRFIFDRAGERPCVVNLSLGTNGGPHDGTSLVEQGLDVILKERPNRAVVIAASNSQAQNIHTSGIVPGDADHDVGWLQSGFGGGEFEMWYPGDREMQVTLIAPDGTAFGPVAPGENLPIGAGNEISIFISNRENDPNNHDNVIGIWLADKLSGGTWIVRLRSLDGASVDYHAWIERNDFAQSSFVAPVPTHTLGSISTGHATIVVGSYDGHKPSFPLSSFSSSGPTRDGRHKPEVSAPGQFVIAARSRTGTGVTRKSGTSMAAPAVTGLCALALAQAARDGRDLPIDTLRAQLIETVLHNPPVGVDDPRYGAGRACGAAVAALK
jgi:hypothetical protein